LSYSNAADLVFVTVVITDAQRGPLALCGVLSWLEEMKPGVA
jgi:hypothetical protein